MTDMTRMRAAVIGLISFAAAEEQILLVAAATNPAGEQPGHAGHWAAVPLRESGRLDQLLAHH